MGIISIITWVFLWLRERVQDWVVEAARDPVLSTSCLRLLLPAQARQTRLCLVNVLVASRARKAVQHVIRRPDHANTE